MVPTKAITDLPAAGLSAKLVRLTGIRMLVVASIVIPYLLYYPDQVGNPTVRRFITFALVQSSLYLALLKALRRSPQAQAYIQFFGDLVFISLLIHTLDATSFSILYIFIISVAAVFLNRTGALVVAGLAYVLYVAVMLMRGIPLGDWAHSMPPPLPGDAVATLQLFYNLVVHLIGFYGVAILTSYLARDAQRSEERLRKKQLDLAYLQGLYGDVIQSMSSGLIITDFDNVIVSLNRPGEEILGHREANLAGRPIEAAGFLSAEQWSSYVQESENASVRSEGQCRRGDGTLIHLGFTLTHLRDAGGTRQGYILLFQDLTEWQELQAQLQMQDRMAAIGQMAAGLAHEVGNPLAAISGSVQMLAGSLRGEAEGGDSSSDKLAEIILKESRRLDRTVKTFLQFAKPREREIADFDVAAMLAEAIQLLRNSGDVEPRHAIEADLVPESAMIQADYDQVSQIFWNLARNALQAMPGGGRLTVSGRLENGYYQMRFQDTGIGMSEEERDRMFHPFKSFFDGGTGLGMAIVYRIVKEHGGEIRVESELHRGSRITVRLPVRQISEAEELTA